VLGTTGVLQTVPALALLAVAIGLLGRIGTAPALLALTLYALLPIVHNTCTGLAEVPCGLAQQRLFFGIATGGTGGTYYPLGGMLAQLISNKATVVAARRSAPPPRPPAPRWAMPSCWATRTSNRPSSPPTSWTRPTTARPVRGAPLKNLRALGALYPETVQLITRADWASTACAT
jgi:hypothetical protein